MNWWIGAAVVAGFVGGGVLIDRWWRHRQQSRLPWLGDEDFRATCPADLDTDRWVAARRFLASTLGLAAERLSAELSVEDAAKHFELIGISSFDLSYVLDEGEPDVTPEVLASLHTVGDVIAFLAQRERQTEGSP